MKTYTSYQNDIPRIINNSLADNLTWATEIINESLRYLTTKYYFNERTYTVPGGTTAQTQFYNLPPQVKKVINVTIKVGNVLWQPKECASRQDWDYLNVIPNLYQSFPSYFFVYNGQLGIYPTPDTTGNVMTINYKTRIPDLSMADVTGTLSCVTNTTTMVASSTPMAQWMAGNWIKVSSSSTDSANGDNQWYQIDAVNSTTMVTLKNPYSGATVTNGAFTVGQTPLLPEDYQDLPLYRMGIIYYTTRFPDPIRAAQYQKLWDDGIKALDDEYGSKTTSVVINEIGGDMVNPNLFVRSLSQNP